MINHNLTPEEIFHFVKILDQSPEGSFNPDLSDGSIDIPLVEKLTNNSYLKSTPRANGKIYVTLMTNAGKVAAQEARCWINIEGRQGLIQLALYDYLKKSHGQSPKNLVGFTSSEIKEPITEDELYEAVDILQQDGAIEIPKGTSNGGAHGLPLRALPVRSYANRMNRRQPPAWYNMHITPTSQTTYHQTTTNNFSDITQSQIAVGNHAQQTQNNNSLSREDLAKITAFCEDFEAQVKESITDLQKQDALLAIRLEIQEELSAAKSSEESQSAFTKFLKKITDIAATEGAHQLVTYCIQQWPLLFTA